MRAEKLGSFPSPASRSRITGSSPSKPSTMTRLSGAARWLVEQPAAKGRAASMAADPFRNSRLVNIEMTLLLGESVAPSMREAVEAEHLQAEPARGGDDVLVLERHAQALRRLPSERAEGPGSYRLDVGGIADVQHPDLPLLARDVDHVLPVQRHGQAPVVGGRRREVVAALTRGVLHPVKRIEGRKGEAVDAGKPAVGAQDVG